MYLWKKNIVWYIAEGLAAFDNIFHTGFTIHKNHTSLSKPKILFLTVFKTIYKNLLKRKVTVVTMLQYYRLFPKFLFSLTKKLYDWTDPSAPTPSSGTPMLMARWSTCRWPPRYICGHHRVITSRGAKIVVFFKFETFCCPFFGSRHCTCANIRWCEEKGVELFL